MANIGSPQTAADVNLFNENLNSQSEDEEDHGGEEIDPESDEGMTNGV